MATKKTNVVTINATAEVAGADHLVLSPLDHDGERYEPGDTVHLTPAQAAPLLGHTVAAAPVPEGSGDAVS